MSVDFYFNGSLIRCTNVKYDSITRGLGPSGGQQDEEQEENPGRHPVERAEQIGASASAASQIQIQIVSNHHRCDISLQCQIRKGDKSK